VKTVRRHTYLIICAAFLLFILPSPLSAADTALSEKLDASIARAAQGLIKLQSPDGGFHSVTYGHLKPGVATTALTLAALSRLPAAERSAYAAQIDAGLKFLLANQGKDSALGTGGEWLEYPAYATALGTVALCELKPSGYEKTISPWVAYLKKSQHDASNGCAPEEPGYGGWGPEGPVMKLRERRADISTTRFVLQALHAAGALDAETRAKALAFVLSCKSGGSGGFYFSTTALDLNKAGLEAARKTYRPYGSATADGLICLTILSAEMDREKANAWLQKNASTTVPGGFKDSHEQAQLWAKGLSGYYRAALAQAAPAAMQNLDWRALASGTLETQRPDGLWSNEFGLMKEDDPLIATPLALDVLIACRRAFK